MPVPRQLIHRAPSSSGRRSDCVQEPHRPAHWTAHGDNASKYFNIEGTDNGKYASFGVLAFEMPKEIKGSKIKGMTLTLVQSVPAFAKDGAVKDLPGRPDL